MSEKEKKESVGRRPKYGEETTTWAFRCPKSKLPEMKKIVRSKLKEWGNTETNQ